MTDEQHVEFTPEEIAQQRELASKATPRPWNLCACGKCGQIGSVPNDCEVADLTAHIPHCEAEGYPYSPHNLEDAAYIVAAVNTHENALATITQLRGEVKRLRLLLADVIELGMKLREEGAAQEPFDDCPELLDEWDTLMMKTIDAMKGGAG